MILTILYTRSNIQSTSEQFISCIHLSFVNLALHPNPQTKISWRFTWRFKHLCLSNHSKLDTCLYELFLTIANTITLKKTDLSSWITLPIHAVILMPEPLTLLTAAVSVVWMLFCLLWNGQATLHLFQKYLLYSEDNVFIAVMVGSIPCLIEQLTTQGRLHTGS